MKRRFGAAVITAVVLHAVLLGFTTLARRSEMPRRLDAATVPRASEVEVSILVDDGLSSVPGEQPPPSAEPSDQSALQARVAQHHALKQQSSRASKATATLEETSASDVGPTLAELDSDAGQEGSSDGASDAAAATRPRVNLGLDGSVMRQATLAGRERPPHAPRAPRRRPPVLVSHWSEGPVRALAQRNAPPEGRALLTLEWDAKGQLLSVTSSAASSHGDDWQRFAQNLGAQLGGRPNTSGQAGGLRVVYLVKTELILPESKRSLLPSAKYATAEQLKANNLHPGTALMFGVKADEGPVTKRVVSVELVKSDAL